MSSNLTASAGPPPRIHEAHRPTALIMAACLLDSEQCMRTGIGRGIRQLTAAGLAVLAAGCGGGGGGSGGSDDAVFSADGAQFPLAVGDRWVYASPSGGDMVLQKTGDTLMFSGVTARAMRSLGLADGSRGTSYYSTDGGGVREHLVDAVDPVSRALDGQYVVRWPANAGDRFVLVDRTVDTGADYDGDGRNERIALRMSIEVIGKETVDTPAGRFVDAARQRLTLSQTLLPTGGSAAITLVGVNESWFAVGVGLVRSTVSLRGAGLDSDGASVLTGYRVGNRSTDSTPPQVQSVSPRQDAAGGGAATVTAVFDEPIDPDSAAEQALQVRDDAGVQLAGPLNVADRSIRFTPAQGWSSGPYAASIGSALTDLLGNPLAAEYRWQFSIDVSGPVIVSSEPAAGAVDVPTGTAIVLRFSEPPDPATVRAETVVLQDLSANSSPVSVSLSVSGNEVTLRPASPLRMAATYQCRSAA
ncbi:hypothetical protein FSC37_14125 [Piscinibacter aquaticus]|uniref:SbsA Ig-like domain-containing protein n=1 Tax=Piscinibacter aquaticus TaxID=392597 RepID=A0A5C6U1W3_9BURK|nr:hypothetical protein FSC37_14125 [Piscinibacter aquaticus]